MNNATAALITVFTLLASVALLAVLVSQKSNTTGVIQSLFSGYTSALQAAVSPITGGSN